MKILWFTDDCLCITPIWALEMRKLEWNLLRWLIIFLFCQWNCVVPVFRSARST